MKQREITHTSYLFRKARIMNSKVAQRIIHYVRSDKVRRAAHLTSYFRLRKHVPNSIGMRHLKCKSLFGDI